MTTYTRCPVPSIRSLSSLLPWESTIRATPGTEPPLYLDRDNTFDQTACAYLEHTPMAPHCPNLKRIEGWESDGFDNLEDFWCLNLVRHTILPLLLSSRLAPVLCNIMQTNTFNICLSYDITFVKVEVGHTAMMMRVARGRILVSMLI